MKVNLHFHLRLCRIYISCVDGADQSDSKADPI